MSDTILTNPIVLDETGQLMLDKLDAIISALNPNAQGVSFDKTGCEIITANNVQGALTQLDSGLDDTNSSLAHKLYNKNGNTSVDLKPYNTDANMYVFPEDGYVTVNSGSGITAGTYIRLAIRSQDGYNIGYIYMIVQGAYQIASLFVRKGTKALFAGSNATNAYSVTYYPLNS